MITMVDRGAWCWVQLSGVGWAQEMALLRAMLSIPLPQGAGHEWADEIGMVVLLRHHGESWYYFPRGLGPDLRHRLDIRKHPYEFHPETRLPADFDDAGWEDAFDRLLNDEQRWAAGLIAQDREGIADLFTRFGKSYVFGAAWIRCGRPVSILIVPRADIIAQLVEELSDWLREEVGYVCSSISTEPKIRRLTICSALSLTEKRSEWMAGYAIRERYRDWLWNIEGVFIDECHIGGAVTQAVHMATPNRICQWGFSATPFSKDPLKDLFLIGFTGPVRAQMKAREGADRGMIAHMLVRWYTLEYPPLMRPSPKTKGGWQDYYAEAVVENAYRNSVIAWIANQHLAGGLSVIIFVERVAHGPALEALIPGAVANVGPVSKQKKIDMKVGFNRGELRCVIVTKRWREGITLQTDVVINAEGMKSDLVTIQKSGRGLMPKDEGRPLVYYDLEDEDVPRRMLHKWAGDRARTYASEGWPQENIGRLVAPEPIITP